jgi:hypothetical protein
MRTFESRKAKREQVPILIGLVSASGAGKTFSALRLASGIQKFAGGKIFVIDTEARRALHYADRFDFEHIDFRAPFSPADYSDAIQYCADQGAKTIVIDSLTHEHTGAGGVLEMHEQELDRLSKGNDNRRKDMQFPAWAKPKAQRTKLLTLMTTQLECNFICTFRAKEKVKLIKRSDRKEGEDPVQSLGFMPIGGEEFVFEMTLNCLLMPNSGGVPTWRTDEIGERLMIKLPEQFRQIFANSAPLSEEIGAAMAKWAAGDASMRTLYEELRQTVKDATSIEQLEALVPRFKEIPDKKLMPATQFKALKALYAERKKTLEAAAADDGSYDDDEPHDPETGEVPLREPGSEG